MISDLAGPGSRLGQHVGRDGVRPLVSQVLAVDDDLLLGQVDVLDDGAVVEAHRSRVDRRPAEPLIRTCRLTPNATAIASQVSPAARAAMTAASAEVVTL